MKRTVLNLLLLGSIAGFFVYFAQSIVQITIFQLRLDITRRQLLNYELASNILNSRFDNLTREDQDFDGEVRMSVLESSVLNTELKERPLRMSPYELGGLAAVNIVRLLNFKGFLSIEDDSHRLIMLQYAFFMQRKKRYERAIEAYTRLETAPGINKDEDRAFVLLHSGYSYALAGKVEDAVRRLSLVRADFAGTHFADSATVLLDFLLNEGRRALRDAENPNLSREERAAAYYRAGRFVKVIDLLEPGIGGSSARTRLMYARSLEESGRIQDSATVYRQLVEAGAEGDIKRNANRRLLLLGNFYSAGEDIKRFAEDQAEKMGDTQAVEQINERLVYFEKPEFFESLQNGGEIEVPAELLEEIRGRIKDSLPPEETAMLARELTTPPEIARETGSQPGSREAAGTRAPVPMPEAVPAPAPVYTPPLQPRVPVYWPPYVAPAPVAGDVRIRLKDGREMIARNIEIRGDLMRIQSGDTSIEMDFTLVQSVAGADKNTGVRLTLEGSETVEGVSFHRTGDMVTLRTSAGDRRQVNGEVLRIASSTLPAREAQP